MSPSDSAASDPRPTATTTSTSSAESSSLLRRAFPAVVFLLLWANEEGSDTVVHGVFAALADANAAARTLAAEHGVASLPSRAAGEVYAESWTSPEGVRGWVEAHPVTPRTATARPTTTGAAPAAGTSGSQQEGKLYCNEEDDDEIDEGDMDGNYD